MQAHSLLYHVYELLMSDKMLSFGKANLLFPRGMLGFKLLNWEVKFYFPNNKHIAKTEIFLGTNSI